MSIDIGDAVLTLGVDTKDLDRGMKNIGAQIKKHQKAIGIGMAAAGTAIVAGMGMAMKSAAAFETAMREVNTMMGLGQEEFAEFSKEVQKLAGDLGVDAVESAKALYQAISAGVPKENVLTFLEIATKAAIGGVTSTEVAVDGLTTVINAFKLPMSDAQKVADIMFTTVKGGKTTMEELSASMFQVAPIAAASGVKFEEVAAALATMTKQGVPTTVATTQLRQAMVALQKPTEDMNKVIKGLGYESGQTMLEELGLAGTLDVLRNATEGSNEMLMKMFGSVEAGQAVLSLTGANMEMFIADLEAMANAAGASEAAFQEMEESVSSQMRKLKASFSSMAISVGTFLIPILKDIVDKIQPIIDSIRTWAEAHPGLTKVIVIGTAAFGGLLIVLGSLLLLMPGITAAMTAFGISVNLAIWPITLIVAAIAGLVAGGILLWQNWDKIFNFFKQGVANLKMIFLTGVKSILGTLMKFTSFLPFVGGKIQELHDSISEMIDADKVKQDIADVKDELERWADKVRDNADEMIEEVDDLYDEWGRKAAENTDTLKRELDDQMDDVRTAHNERLDLIDEEYDAQLKLIDSELAAEIEGFESQIDAIDNAIDQRREADENMRDQERVSELQARIRTEEDVFKRAELQEDLQELITELQKKQWEKALRADKDALREQIRLARSRVQDAKRKAEEEYNTKRQLEENKFKTTMENINKQKVVLDNALQVELARMRIELDAFKEMNLEKLADARAFVNSYNALMGQMGATSLGRRGIGGGIVETPAVREAKKTMAELDIPEAPIGWDFWDWFHKMQEAQFMESFGTGGIAMRPMTARIAERGPEAVIPLDKIQTMIGNRTVNIYIELDGKVIGRAIGRPLVDSIRVKTGVRI